MQRETYRGVRLAARALRGRDYGRVRCTVNGAVFGDWIGTEASELESMRRTVDAARERPDAYPDYWQARP